MLTVPSKNSTGASRSDNCLVLKRLDCWVLARMHAGHVPLDTRLPCFSVCDIEKLGETWGQGYAINSVNATCKSIIKIPFTLLCYNLIGSSYTNLLDEEV